MRKRMLPVMALNSYYVCYHVNALQYFVENSPVVYFWLERSTLASKTYSYAEIGDGTFKDAL